MPTKPKTPCGYPGCPELIHGRYCDTHQRIVNKQYERYERDPLTQKRYGREWKHIRDRYIKSHPLCNECLKNNILTTAAEVHHILPLSHGGTNDFINLMSLCKPCHSSISAKDGDRWRKH